MKKVLILLLVVGVLILGTSSVIEELSENCSQDVEFSDGETFEPDGDSGPCGKGEGAGQGGIPG